MTRRRNLNYHPARSVMGHILDRGPQQHFTHGMGMRLVMTHHKQFHTLVLRLARDGLANLARPKELGRASWKNALPGAWRPRGFPCRDGPALHCRPRAGSRAAPPPHAGPLDQRPCRSIIGTPGSRETPQTPHRATPPLLWAWPPAPPARSEVCGRIVTSIGICKLCRKLCRKPPRAGTALALQQLSSRGGKPQVGLYEATLPGAPFGATAGKH